jgi:peptidoglycan/xylan/chitin deacetylase (PgdA/CDA1 family)
LKRKLRDIAAACLGFTLISLGFIRRAKKQIFKTGVITGIYFHNPSKKLFEKSIKWLIKNGFTIITADTLLEILQRNRSVVPGTVWISLDDGWKENMVNVVPFAIESKIPVTFFISTGPVGSSGVFWWSIADKFRNMLPEPFKSNFGMLWKARESERAAVINELLVKVKGKYHREAMTIDDVKKISGYDFLNIESHTVNHVITPNCTKEELLYELSESKRTLEEWTGRKVNFFSYPNGDYTDNEKEFLISSGYIAAVAQDDEFITRNTAIFKVPRFSAGEGFFSEELCHMFGVWQNVIKKIKGKK